MKKFLFALGTLIGTLRAEDPNKNKAFQRQVIAAVIWAEARSEGYDAMRAVAEVIRNRTHYTGKGAYEIVTAPYQFSCLNGVSPFRLARRAAESNSVADRNALVFAEDLAEHLINRKLSGTRANTATHFHDSSVSPRWAFQQTPVARYGSLLFYRLI